MYGAPSEPHTRTSEFSFIFWRNDSRVEVWALAAPQALIKTRITRTRRTRIPMPPCLLASRPLAHREGSVSRYLGVNRSIASHLRQLRQQRAIEPCIARKTWAVRGGHGGPLWSGAALQERSCATTV